VAVLVWVFATIERRSRDPLVPFAIFSSAGLRRANIGAVTLFGTYISFQFLTTQYLQTLAGWSAMSTALAFLPAGVMVVVLSTRMGSLLGRFGPTPLTGLAFICLVLAYGVFLRAGVHPDYPAVLLPAMLLVGLAFGLGFSSLTVAATAGVPNSEQGLAASLFQTSFQVGGAVVLAIVTAVVDAGGAGQLVSAPATLAAYRPALGLITGIAAIGMLVALSGLRRRPAQQVELPGNLGTGNLRVGELAASGMEADKVSGERGDGPGVGDLADELAAGELAAGDLVGCPALQQASDVAGGSTKA
jgi:predicted MFS family arabinose efflux permease